MAQFPNWESAGSIRGDTVAAFILHFVLCCSSACCVLQYLALNENSCRYIQITGEKIRCTYYLHNLTV